MSISPQSLARTRDKRSLRIPARFDDFSEIPHEYTYRNVAEALKMKGRSHRSSCNEQTPPTKKALLTTNEDSVKKDEGLLKKVEITTKKDDIGSKKDEITSKKDEIISKKDEITSSSKKDDITTKKDEISMSAKGEAPKKDEPIKKDEIIKKDEVIKKDEIIKKGEFIKKSPFHPSITISNGVKFSETITKPLVEETITKPLVEHRPNSQATTPASPSSNKTSSSSSSSSRKRSKGFSLMVKPSNSVPLQNNVNRQTTLTPQQQTKYFNAQNMQYGTRLMLNEPIYLPRSVPTIAPITATLQQIANQARKPPFLSKKAEAFIAYQEERKLNYITSTHSALVRVTRYLGVKDRLNLRCVNKAWKSIVDSEASWKKILVTSGDGDLNWNPMKDFLSRFKTTDIIFDGYVPSPTVDVRPPELGAFLSNVVGIKRVWIKSMDAVQNCVAFDMLKGFRLSYKPALSAHHNGNNNLKLYWRVKVGIDALGVAYVKVTDETPSGYDGGTALVELYDLDQLLNSYSNCPTVTPPSLNIKPI